MTENIYRRMQRQLDQYSVGFPETESGIELTILRRLFNENDASLFVQMTPALELPESVASRLGRPLAEVEQHLDDMAERGLLFRLRKGGVAKYGAIPFVHGIFEFQVGSMDPDLAKLTREYFEESFGDSLRAGGEYFLRTVPVQESVEATTQVASYDDAVAILKSKDRIVVTQCICRVAAKHVQEGCDKPAEACFMFGSMGRYYLDRGLGREIPLQEAISILETCREAGLVTQPASSQNPTGMCNCCGDCCGLLAALKKHDKPAECVFSNYVVALDADACDGCEECIDRCQMSALTMPGDPSEGVVSLNVNRCIGCGLCVSACPCEALTLHRKHDAELREPPESTRDQMMALAMKRGVL